jgi:PAS domain S-box-containing protein
MEDRSVKEPPAGGDGAAPNESEQRRRAEQALRATEERHRLIVESARDYAILTMDADGRIESWSPGAEAVYGWSAAEAIGMDVAMTFTPEDREAGVPEQELGTALAQGSAPDVRWHLRKDGRRVFIDGVTRRLQGADGSPPRCLKIGQDVTERIDAEAALRELNETLEQRVAERTAELAQANAALTEQVAQRERAEAARSEVLRRLVTAEEDERRRLSRELHDQMGQEVTGLLLGLKALEREAGSPGREAAIEALERVAHGIARGLQHLALQLRPPALDNLGLELALQSHVEEWSERHGVAADFHGTGMDGRLPQEMETTIYRVVQEGLTNVLKHAGATHVSLVLERRTGVVSAILEDDGGGFDVEATLAAPEKARRLGLRGIRERLALLGGSLVVESSPGRGTTLFVRLPDPAFPAGEEAR